MTTNLTVATVKWKKFLHFANGNKQVKSVKLQNFLHFAKFCNQPNSP